MFIDSNGLVSKMTHQWFEREKCLSMSQPWLLGNVGTWHYNSLSVKVKRLRNTVSTRWLFARVPTEGANCFLLDLATISNGVNEKLERSKSMNNGLEPTKLVNVGLDAPRGISNIAQVSSQFGKI